MSSKSKYSHTLNVVEFVIDIVEHREKRCVEWKYPLPFVDGKHVVWSQDNLFEFVGKEIHYSIPGAPCRNRLDKRIWDGPLRTFRPNRCCPAGLVEPQPQPRHLLRRRLSKTIRSSLSCPADCHSVSGRHSVCWNVTLTRQPPPPSTSTAPASASSNM